MAQRIIGFSVATLLVFILGSAILGSCLIASAMITAGCNLGVHSEQVTSLEEIPNGELGPLCEAILNQPKMSAGEMEQAFGPLNKAALHETKEGWLLDRLRARRQARQQQYCQQVCTQSRPVYQPQPRIQPYVQPSPYQPLPSPMPTNPMAPVTPVDIVPSVPYVPAPDIESLPSGVVPSVCIGGQCYK